jgi:hypothetical protein
MPKKSGRSNPGNLVSAVGTCLPQLKILSLDLDTYGTTNHADTVRSVIATLEKGYRAKPKLAATDFVVAETFIIRRSQVARLLLCAFARFEIADFVEPPVLHFRADPARVLRHVDYPLNEGGALAVRSKEPSSQVFQLDLESIAIGLNVMAVECPRHLADFLNGRADPITSDAFLQCCLFGELVY